MQDKNAKESDSRRLDLVLTLNLLTTTIVAPPSNASKWQMGFNSAFKGLIFKCMELRFVNIISKYMNSSHLQ